MTESYTIPASMSLSSEAFQNVPPGATVKSRKEVGRRVLGGLGSSPIQSPTQVTSSFFRNTSGGLAPPAFHTKDAESIYSVAGPDVLSQMPHMHGARMSMSPGSPRDSVSKYKYQQSMSPDRFTEKGERIIKEYYKEYDYPTEHKILVEEEYERVVVVPEKRMVEKIVQIHQKVRKRIIEVEVPIIIEKEVEVPEIEYREVPIPVVERKLQENIIRVPKVEIRERIVEVPKIVYEEREVEVACPEYYEVEYETIIEVPEVQTETVIVPKPMPQYIEVDVPDVVDVYIEEDRPVKVPVPLEYTTHLDLQFPCIQPVYNQTEVPVYMPRFIEVAVPSDKMTDVQNRMAKEIDAKINATFNGEVLMPEAMSDIANEIQRHDIARLTGNNNWPTLWERGQIKMMNQIQETSKDIENVIIAGNSMSC